MSTLTADTDTLTAPTAPVTPIAPDIDEAFRDIAENEDQTDDGNDIGDHELLSHYVRKDDIVRAAVDGVAVFALCGKKWRPRRNPESYPVCPECRERWESMRQE